MDEQLGGRAMLNDVRDNLPALRDAMRELPAIIQHIGELAAEGKIQVDVKSSALRQIQEQLDEQRHQRYWLTAAAAGIVSGTLILTLGTLPIVGWSLLALGGVAALAARP